MAKKIPTHTSSPNRINRDFQLQKNTHSDHLLSMIHHEEEQAQQGKLKIFLGMAAGVGKTYAMLQTAHSMKKKGLDVVIGVVEHHGRIDTKKLTDGLEELPLKSHQYRGVNLQEFDLDGAIARHPDLILMDELAHSNIEGSRHKKRYLDVLEILKSGIDVYTTLNIQHVESRLSTVEEISNVAIHETVPDLILDRANEIILVDLSPDELLKRLDEGKIYSSDQATIARQNFFKKGPLTALRELSLRIATERVDRDLRDYKSIHGIHHVWKSGGRLMVAIYASPYAEALIRWTRRVSDVLGLTWIGAYVENDQEQSPQEQQLLKKNMNLVQQLGGEVISLRDSDTVKGLLQIARQNNVTQIIVGKSQNTFFKDFIRGGSLANRLIQQSGPIDIYVVSSKKSLSRKTWKSLPIQQNIDSFTEDLGKSLGIILGTWILASASESLIGYRAIGILFLLSVCLSGLFLGRYAVILLSIVFAFIHNFFFIPPKFTVSISKPEDFMLLLMFFVAASVIGHLTTRLKNKERLLKSREERTIMLYNLAKDISSRQSTSEILALTQEHLEAFFKRDFVIHIHHLLQKELSPDARSSTSFDSEKEFAVAKWVLTNGQPAGYGTETLVASEYTHFPIVGTTGILGVIAISKDKSQKPLSTDQITFINAASHLLASGIERDLYYKKLGALQIADETQKLYKSLFDCVSHELKTPLAAIKGSASAILDDATRASPGAIETLGSQILDSSDRLQILVDNLLDMTRLESGHIRPKREIHDAIDIITSATHTLQTQLARRTLNIHINPPTKTIACDLILTSQALRNILHNALMYTPSHTPLEIIVEEYENHKSLIAVRDHGKGLPLANPNLVFEKFYRAESAYAGGSRSRSFYCKRFY